MFEPIFHKLLGTFSHEESQILGKIDTWKFSGHFGVKLWVGEVVFLKQELIRSVPERRKQATTEKKKNKYFCNSTFAKQLQDRERGLVGRLKGE